MAEGDRHNFAALISLLMQFENKLIGFYEATAKKTKQTKLKSLLNSYSERNREHRDKMEKAQRETVIEMALEPIMGLRLNERLAQIDTTIKDEKMDSVEKAIMLEKMMQKLYAEASSKVMNISAELSELLRQLSQESVNREAELASNR